VEPSPLSRQAGAKAGSTHFQTAGKATFDQNTTIEGSRLGDVTLSYTSTQALETTQAPSRATMSSPLPPSSSESIRLPGRLLRELSPAELTRTPGELIDVRVPGRIAGRKSIANNLPWEIGSDTGQTVAKQAGAPHYANPTSALSLATCVRDIFEQCEASVKDCSGRIGAGGVNRQGALEVAAVKRIIIKTLSTSKAFQDAATKLAGRHCPDTQSAGERWGRGGGWGAGGSRCEDAGGEGGVGEEDDDVLILSAAARSAFEYIFGVVAGVYCDESSVAAALEQDESDSQAIEQNSSDPHEDTDTTSVRGTSVGMQSGDNVGREVHVTSFVPPHNIVRQVHTSRSSACHPQTSSVQGQVHEPVTTASPPSEVPTRAVIVEPLPSNASAQPHQPIPTLINIPSGGANKPSPRGYVSGNISPPPQHPQPMDADEQNAHLVVARSTNFLPHVTLGRTSLLQPPVGNLNLRAPPVGSAISPLGRVSQNLEAPFIGDSFLWEPAQQASYTQQTSYTQPKQQTSYTAGILHTAAYTPSADDISSGRVPVIASADASTGVIATVADVDLRAATSEVLHAASELRRKSETNRSIEKRQAEGEVLVRALQELRGIVEGSVTNLGSQINQTQHSHHSRHHPSCGMTGAGDYNCWADPPSGILSNHAEPQPQLPCVPKAAKHPIVRAPPDPVMRERVVDALTCLQPRQLQVLYQMCKTNLLYQHKHLYYYYYYYYYCPPAPLLYRGFHLNTTTRCMQRLLHTLRIKAT
jgi:hypothetical protein